MHTLLKPTWDLSSQNASRFNFSVNSSGCQSAKYDEWRRDNYQGSSETADITVIPRTISAPCSFCVFSCTISAPCSFCVFSRVIPVPRKSGHCKISIPCTVSHRRGYHYSTDITISEEQHTRSVPYRTKAGYHGSSGSSPAPSRILLPYYRWTPLHLSGDVGS